MLKTERAKRTTIFCLSALLLASTSAFFLHGCGNGQQEGGAWLKDESLAEDFAGEKEDSGEYQAGEGKPYVYSPLFGGSEEIMILRDIKFENLADSERVVLEFVGQKINPGTGIPRYHTGYGILPYLDLEGNMVPVEGTHWVDLACNSSFVDISPPGGYILVYTGQQDIHPGLDVIKQVRFVNPYEDNTLILLIGLAKRTPYRVLELLSPPRLIIEVQK